VGVVQCLINELGADFNHADKNGRTALEIARSAGHQSIVTVIEGAAQVNLKISAECEVRRAAAALSGTEAIGTASRVSIAEDVMQNGESLLLVTQREAERLEVLLLAERKKSEEMRYKLIEADLLLQALKVASAQKASETTALVASLAAKEQDNVALAASLQQEQQTLAEERLRSTEAKTDEARSHKKFEELLIEEAAKDKKKLEAQLVKEKRHEQAQSEAEQKRLQGLLAQSKEKMAEERSRRERMEQKATQEKSERMHLEQELTIARTLAAVSIAERLPGMPGVELRALEDAAHEERMRRRVQRDVQRNVRCNVRWSGRERLCEKQGCVKYVWTVQNMLP
jgi:hypothetical protein